MSQSPASEPAIEQVLVIPTPVFHEVGHFQGFCPDIDKYLEVILDPAHASYRPRNLMEEDASFKQLIPYCIFRCDGQIFQYQRGNSQGEARLHAKRSVGVGGHVSTLDLNGEGCAYSEGMKREIEEEVFLNAKWTEQCVGLINDDESEVGKVHLGVVHVFDLETPDVKPKEASMLDSGFRQPAAMLTDLDAYETWSQICLKALFSA